MLSRGHSRLEVNRAECGRGGQQDHIHAAVDDLLVCVQAHKLAALGHIHLIWVVLFQPLQAGRQLVFKGVAYSP